VIQLHWPRSELLIEHLEPLGVTIVSPARHPLDVLLSMNEFARKEPNVANWLGGSVVNRAMMASALAGEPSFLAWATSETAARLLAITPAWWGRPATLRLRYEDLWANPRERFAEAVELAGWDPARPLDEVLSANTAEAIHLISGRVHVWRGRPGAWTELLGPGDSSQIAQRHESVFRLLGYEIP
jgi:hypothetical protein